MTQDGVLAKKLDLTFGRLDGDGDGNLVGQDLANLALNLGAAFGLGSDDERVVKLGDALGIIWATDLSPMDVDGSGSIDSVEFSTGMRKAIDEDPDGFVERFGAMTQAWMDVADTNGNGVVDLEEFTAMYTRTLGVSAEDLAVAFEKLDRDGSGALDNDEVRTAAAEYYTSDDPEALGNWLYGPL